MEVDNVDEMNEDGDDSSSSDDNEEQLENEIRLLEKRISENLYDYDAHVRIIKLLKEVADLDRLRMARNRMSEHFPLTPDLWLNWLQDEIRLADSSEEKRKIVDLFERAVKDYLSVDIWLEYAQFSIGIMDGGIETGLGGVREVFERALTAGGLHVSKGALLWEAFVEFETVALSMLQAKIEEESGKSAYDGQLKRIANLFKRQLLCPLLDMEETKERFDMWLQDNSTSGQNDLIDSHLVSNIYKKTLEKLKKIEQFEEKLLLDTDNLLSSYKNYIEYEKSKEGTPPRVICLYERAIADGANLCLEPTLWLDYIEYVDTVLNSDTTVDVCSRAIRNCPWSLQIYQYYIRMLEKHKRPHQHVTGAVEQALTAGFQTVTDYRDIWMCFLEYLRRRYDEPDLTKDEEELRLEQLRSAFERAISHISELDNADPDNVIVQYWARIEAIYCKNMEKSRSLWSEIMKEERNNTASLWMEYINLERTYGDTKHLRKLFPKALMYVRDWPEVVGNAWLNYERDEGSLDSYMSCLNKYKEKLKKIQDSREKEEKKQKSQEQFIRKPKRAGLGFTEEIRGRGEIRTKEEKKPIVGYKRKVERDVEEPYIKKGKVDKDEKQETSEEIVEKLLKEKQKDASHGVTVAHDSSKDHRTVFVSNLDFETEESVIREIFSKVGTITDLRLVKDFKGRSKGFCYVEFKSQDEMREALEKDREMVNGRPMFVSKCDPDKQTRGSGFKFSTNLEKKKLFVKGLPFSTTVDDLKQLFGQFGTLKDVRIVTYRNGHSKGLAYVDFEDEVSAAQAIVKTDGTKIGDREISVALSNPPARKNESSLLSKDVTSLGGGPKEVGPRGRGRTQVSFLPRSLQLQQNTASSLANLSIGSPGIPSVKEETKKQMSNSQFRDLLLSKKE